jgi:hypothetical protein
VLPELIAAAQVIPTAYDAAKTGADILKVDEYPLVTFHKLETGARAHYLAGLVVIGIPSIAYAAEAHVRAVIEFMAHVAWITGMTRDVRRCRPETRALCWEWASVKQLRHQLERLGPEYGDVAKARRALDEWHARISEAHRALCKCRKGRTADDVPATLKQLAQAQEGLDVFLELYYTSSMMLHLQVTEALVSGPEDQPRRPTPASDAQRARTLFTLVHCYGQGTAGILGWQLSPNAGAFWDQVSQISSRFALLVPSG